jgi:N-methylhydantoinase A
VVVEAPRAGTRNLQDLTELSAVNKTAEKGRTKQAAKAAPKRGGSTAAGPGASARQLRIAVDIGGTFTDGLAVLEPGGRIWVGKCLTTPDDPGEAVSTVIADLLRQVALAGRSGKAAASSAPPVGEVVHGTTLVTNTLIERKGAPTALITTTGLGDTLDIGREWRYDLYDLDLQIPAPLVPAAHRIEIAERLGASGEVIEALEPVAIEAALDALAAMRVEAVAVCLLHAYLNDAHERRLQAALAQRFPSLSVSVSAAVAREIGEYERMSTTTANAYVQPLVARYLEQLQGRIREQAASAQLKIMVSSGGFTSGAAAADSPILLLESGPAAGVLSALNTARSNGIDAILAFDMGGTTAKACVGVGGEPLIAHSFECARVHRFKRGSGLPILIPSIDLIEIGAGGGSIAHVNDLGLLNVGPESAGAVPGPACYQRGGREATVTDADLVLGYLNPDNFLGGEMKLSVEAASAALARLGRPLKLAAEQVARGIVDIVNENMASAARIHIAEKGHDPREFTLVATGGAGPLHAVEVARRLRIPRVLATIAAGAGSCLGLLAAPARVDRAWSSPALLAETDWATATRVMRELRADAQAELDSASVAPAGVVWTIGAQMRYLGQGHSVPVSIPYRALDVSAEPLVRRAFEAQYRKLYGDLVPGAQPQVITWRLTARATMKRHRFQWGDARVSSEPAARGKRRAFLPVRGRFAEVPVFDRYSLAPGSALSGPLILEERESTLVVPVASRVRILPDYTVSIEIKEFD